MPTIGCKSNLSREGIVGRVPRYFIYMVYTEQTLKNTKKPAYHAGFFDLWIRLQTLAVALFVLLTRTAGAGIVAADLLLDLDGSGFALVALTGLSCRSHT